MNPNRFQQGGFAPQALQQQQQQQLQAIQQLYQTLQPHTVSPFEQALQMAGQMGGLGGLQQGLQGSIGGIGSLLGNLARQGMLGGMQMGPEIGQTVQRPAIQRTMQPIKNNVGAPMAPMPAQTLGYESTGPGTFNLVTPNGHAVGGGGFGTPTPNTGGQPVQGMQNPFLQMLHQRGLMQPFSQSRPPASAQLRQPIG